MNSNKQPKRSKESYHKLERSVAVNLYKRQVHKKKEHEPTNVLANFLIGRWILWVMAYVKYRFWFKHRFLSYEDKEDKGIYTLCAADNNKTIKVALVSDWATDTKESKLVAEKIHDHNADYTIHLGDTYFVGDKEEIRNNYKPNDSFWPYAKLGSFALVGNHEMYSNGYGYFDELLPWMGLYHPQRIKQKASFFCLENEYWQIIGLDTGYRSVGIPFLEVFFSRADLRKEVLKWLKEEVKIQESNKGLILLTHHQYTSAFDTTYPATGRQLSELIGNRKALWFWGHEHRLTLFGQSTINKGFVAYGRCIGHGGMPVSLVDPTKIKQASNVVVYDNRSYQQIGNTNVGHNGYVVLELEDHQLRVDYFDENNLLLSEYWEYDTNEKNLKGIDVKNYCSELVVVQDLNKLNDSMKHEEEVK